MNNPITLFTIPFFVSGSISDIFTEDVILDRKRFERDLQNHG